MEKEKPKRKPYPSDLTDKQWKRIKPLIPFKRKKTGRPPKDPREVINGILYVLSTGCRWKDLPHDIEASPTTCNDKLREYQRKGIWTKINNSLKQEAWRKGKIKLNNSYLDSSPVKSKKGAKKK